MNVEKGDLAIQIKSWADNVGKIVRVGEFLGTNPIYGGYRWLTGEGPCWMVSYDRPVRAAAKGTGKLEFIGCSSPCADAWLRRIPDIPDTEDTDTEQPIKEVA